MELVTKKRLMLFAGRGNEQLSKEIAECLKTPLGDIVLSTFANGELYCRYGENIRGADIFVIQSHCDPINDRIMEQLIMIDAAKRASAKRITAVCPFYGYGRQDRKAEGREPITARLVADMLTAAGADRVVTVDLHTGQTQGFFDMPVDHLTGVPLLAAVPRREAPGPRRRRSCRPTPAAASSPRRFANYLDDAGIPAGLAFIDKRRPKGTHNVAEATEVVGEVNGKHLRARRRHHRHRRHDHQRRRAPRGPGRGRGLRGRHPRRALGARGRAAAGRRRSARWCSPTRCRSRGRSSSTG